MYWQMVFTHMSKEDGFVCLNCYSRIYEVMHIWFNNKMILLLLAGSGDRCVWIIWLYQIGNR